LPGIKKGGHLAALLFLPGSVFRKTIKPGAAVLGSGCAWFGCTGF